MSLPILYKSSEREFTNNGIGIMSDAISCIVTEERNGSFELEMEYPVTGLHYAELQEQDLILAPPNPYMRWQPFRVYRTTRPLRGIVKIYAQHSSYDLTGETVLPFVAFCPADAMAQYPEKTIQGSRFTFTTDKESEASMTISVPSTTRSTLGGVKGSFLDVYGGEFTFDRWEVRHQAARGADRGTTLRYGKNVTDLEQDKNISRMYSHVCPYWKGSEEDSEVMTLPEEVVAVPVTLPFTRIYPLDLSAEFSEKPTEDEMRAYTESFIVSSNMDTPKVSITVSFLSLEQAEEFDTIADLEHVELCDTVHVYFEDLGVQAAAKCIKTVYNVLADRYKEVEIGDPKYTLADTLGAQVVAGTNNTQNIHILQQQIQGSSIVFYAFHNRSNVTVRQTETQVASVTIVTNKTTTALLLAEALIHVSAETVARTVDATMPAVDADGNETTQALQLTFQEETPVQLTVRFYINGEQIADWTPQETYTAGAHVLPLYYCFRDLPANYRGTISIRMEASSGSVAFDMGQLQGVVFAQNLAAGFIWDGTLTVEEVISPVAIRSYMGVAALAEEVNVQTQAPTPAAITEVVSRFSLRSRMGVVGFAEEISVNPVWEKQTVSAARLSAWTYNDRYVWRGENGVQLRTAWTYQSVESEIDSGRMTVVKAMTADLASVESLEVSPDG